MDLLTPCLCFPPPPVYLFVGLMMMYLLLRTLHKMADLHGLTTFLQLPRCEESDLDEDRKPIVDNEQKAASPSAEEKAASTPLDPESQHSYNTINRDWVMWRQRKEKATLTTSDDPLEWFGNRLMGWTGILVLTFFGLFFFQFVFSIAS